MSEPMKNAVKRPHVEKTMREAGMLVTVAAQGTGKTYQNMRLIVNAVKDKIDIGVKGRKSLILDTNGEYTTEQFAKNGHPNFTARLLKVSDVRAWCLSDVVECRRIDMKALHIKDKVKILCYVMSVACDCIVVLEDINTITTNINEMGDLVSEIVNLRHKGCDVIISYQSLRAVEPRIFTNSRWIRMHYCLGDVYDVKGKLNEPDLAKLGQLIINNRYQQGDKRFFLYIVNMPPKLEGEFSKDEFKQACRKLLTIKQKKIKEYMLMHECSKEHAINAAAEELYESFYGNVDK